MQIPIYEVAGRIFWIRECGFHTLCKYAWIYRVGTLSTIHKVIGADPLNCSTFVNRSALFCGLERAREPLVVTDAISDEFNNLGQLQRRWGQSPRLNLSGISRCPPLSKKTRVSLSTRAFSSPISTLKHHHRPAILPKRFSCYA